MIETQKDARAIESNLDIERDLVSEWLPASGYALSKGTEITVYHKPKSDHDKTYLELWILIEKIQ